MFNYEEMLQILYIKCLKKAIFHVLNTLYRCRENEREFKMGISNFQCNIHSMILQKSQYNLQLMRIQDQRSAITAELDDVINTSEAWYKDPKVKALQAKEDDFDSQIEEMETKLNAIEANLESLQKQKSNNIKDDVPSLSL